MKLTRRQSQIGELIYDGHRQSEIAIKLGISIQTVKTHTGHLRSVLDIPRRFEIRNLPRPLFRRLLDTH